VRRAVLLALGVLVALAGSRALSAAGGMLWAYAPARDADGFVMAILFFPILVDYPAASSAAHKVALIDDHYPSMYAVWS
jgi:ABC-type transport system involved in cytochrome c biogenesis permease component